MKNITVILTLGVLLLAGASTSFANQSNTGCGLGTLVLVGTGNHDSIVIQVLIATTNGTSGSQTFGISTGTSNCKRPTAVVSNERLEKFVADNMDNLAIDIAGGQGETLETVAELIKVPAEGRTDFYSALQKNFDKIYTASDVESAHVIDSIIQISSESKI